jgi:hypothetical protein
MGEVEVALLMPGACGERRGEEGRGVGWSRSRRSYQEQSPSSFEKETYLRGEM